jgi:hypothetical protein
VRALRLHGSDHKELHMVTGGDWRGWTGPPANGC